MAPLPPMDDHGNALLRAIGADIHPDAPQWHHELVRSIPNTGQLSRWFISDFDWPAPGIAPQARTGFPATTGSSATNAVL